MASVTFSPKSRQDLIEIGDYIARDSRANARRFVARPMAPKVAKAEGGRDRHKD